MTPKEKLKDIMLEIGLEEIPQVFSDAAQELSEEIYNETCDLPKNRRTGTMETIQGFEILSRALARLGCCEEPAPKQMITFLHKAV